MRVKSSKKSKKEIAIVGLGYVGLPLAVEFGKTRPVVGYDIDKHRIDELRSSYDSSGELGKDEINSAKFLKFSSDPGSLETSEIYIITVPTPINAAKSPDFSHLLSASHLVGKKLKPRDIVIYESTVYPGALEEICIPVLSEESGLSCAFSDLGDHEDVFYCGYSPERINPGDKERNIASIIKVTSGSTASVADEIDELYSEIITVGTFKASSIKVAEAAKVIENCQRDINIAFVNELSLIFSKLGIDTSEVLSAASTKWNFLKFTPGLVGGHCIGIDPYYLAHKAASVGHIPELLLAGRRINESMAKYIATLAMKKILSRKNFNGPVKTLIMGLAFKENCSDIRNSKAFEIVSELKEWGCDVDLYDPMLNNDQQKDALTLNIQEIKGNEYDIIFLTVPHKVFLSMTDDFLSSLVNIKTGSIFVDIKSAFSKDRLEKLGFDVVRL